MAKTHKCRQCPYLAPSWQNLEDHWQDQHLEQYLELKKWLDNTTSEKLIQADKLSKEGLKGHHG